MGGCVLTFFSSLMGLGFLSVSFLSLLGSSFLLSDASPVSIVACLLGHTTFFTGSGSPFLSTRFSFFVEGWWIGFLSTDFTFVIAGGRLQASFSSFLGCGWALTFFSHVL